MSCACLSKRCHSDSRLFWVVAC